MTSVGALMASLTSGTLVIALPDILRDLKTDIFSLLWIVVGYTLVATVLVLNAGRVADMVGRARSYTLGFVIFTIASILCAFAPDAQQLILWRLVQGVGGALLMANATALVTDAFPRIGAGPSARHQLDGRRRGRDHGPDPGRLADELRLAGDLLVQRPDRPLGARGRRLILVEQSHPDRHVEIDWLGSILYFVGLMGLMTALAFGGVYGWTTWWVIGGILAFVLALPIFLWVELHHRAPLLDLTLFQDRLFAMGNLTGFLNAIARNGVLFLLVFYFQGARGEDPVTAGIMLAPLAIGLVVLSPISGILADRYGSRALATAGHGDHRDRSARAHDARQSDTPYWQVALWQLIVGAGSGIFNSPNTSAVMGVVPPNKRGVGAGMRMMLMQSGFVVSIALAIGLVTSSMDPKVMVAIFSGAQIGGRGSASRRS